MNIKYILRGTKDIGKVYIRLYQSGFDVSIPVGLSLEFSSWNKLKEASDNESFNLTLQKLKVDVLEKLNSDYGIGIIIDKDWLKNVVSVHFNRDYKEKNLSNLSHRIYLSDFCDFWLKNEAKKWKVSARKYMDDGLISQYERFATILKSYEKSSKKIKLSEVDQEELYNFVSFLEDEDYNSSTINRHVTRLKFFCNRALELNINVNKGFNQRIFIEDTKDAEDVYLNEVEIESILKLDLTDHPKLNNARDYFIIGLHSGFRIGDLLENLKLEHIKGDFIEIKTQKTGQNVVIPVHDEIRKVLKRNFGFLPPKVDRNSYNIDIKTICQLAEIDEMVYGSKFDKEKLRKVYSYYKKYELITSHVARKSIATMYYGKLPNEVLCSILGWSNEAMLSFYNKTSKQDYAKQFKNYIENGK